MRCKSLFFYSFVSQFRLRSRPPSPYFGTPIRAAERNYFKCTWIPSHLGDEGNEKSSEKAIKDGIATAQNIEGNKNADQLAGVAVAQNNNFDELVADTNMRKETTAIAHPHRHRCNNTATWLLLRSPYPFRNLAH